jgi:hypothetical protein
VTQTSTDTSLPVDATSRQALADLAQSAITGTLAVIACELPGVAADAAAWLAHQIGGADGSGDTDVRVAAPEQGRWTVRELDARVAAAAGTYPRVRNLLVVTDADRMDTGAAEHLLKVVEEPAAPTLFLFAVRSPQVLLPTIRGRAAAEVTLRPASPQRRAAELAARGVPQEAAGRIVELSGTAVSVPAGATAKNADTILDCLERGGRSAGRLRPALGRDRRLRHDLRRLAGLPLPLRLPGQ